MKKKFLAFLLAAFVLCLSACSNGKASAPQSEPAPEQGIGELSGVNYTILVDLSKWANVYSYIGEVSGYAEKVNPGAGISADQYESMCDGMFINYEHTNANFNITTIAIGTDVVIDADYYAPILKEQYAAAGGYDFKSCETVDINGYKALRADVNSSMDGNELKMTQFIFWEGGFQVTITYSSDLDSYEAAWADFEETLETITFAAE